MPYHVGPIRDPEKMRQFKLALQMSSYRNYMLWIVGVNTGLRASDFSKLRKCDIMNVRGKSYFELQEQKTGKKRRCYINGEFQMELDRYIQSMNDTDYLFPSRNGMVHGKQSPITVTQIYRIFIEAGNKVGLYDIGTHTCRKTFGYWHYKKFKDVALLQKIFNHSSPSITLRYIGISEEEIEDTMMEGFLPI